MKRSIIKILLLASILEATAQEQCNGPFDTDCYRRNACRAGTASPWDPICAELKVKDFLKQNITGQLTNTSDKEVVFFLMGLYATTEKTAQYYPPLKCYINQTIISDPYKFPAGASGAIAMNDEGKKLLEAGALFGGLIVAVQTDIITDLNSGQAPTSTGFWQTDSSGKRTWVNESFKNIIVARGGTNYFTRVTKSWISSPKKKKFIIKNGADNNFRFPEDFIFDKETREDFSKPDYDTVIRAMQKAEEKKDDKIFEAKYFNKDYLKSLPDKDVYELYSSATNISLQPIVYQNNPTLSSLFALGKLKGIASTLIQAAIGVIITILSGGAAASLVADLIQQAASTGMDLAQEISDIKQRTQVPQKDIVPSLSTLNL